MERLERDAPFGVALSEAVERERLGGAERGGARRRLSVEVEERERGALNRLTGGEDRGAKRAAFRERDRQRAGAISGQRDLTKRGRQIEGFDGERFVLGQDALKAKST